MYEIGTSGELTRCVDLHSMKDLGIYGSFYAIIQIFPEDQCNHISAHSQQFASPRSISFWHVRALCLLCFLLHVVRIFRVIKI